MRRNLSGHPYERTADQWYEWARIRDDIYKHAVAIRIGDMPAGTIDKGITMPFICNGILRKSEVAADMIAPGKIKKETK